LILAALEWIWRLPWPERLRRRAFDAAGLPVVRSILFPQFLVGVVGIIRDGDGKVLLLHHTYRSTPWGLPTGFLERGEQPIDALAREIEEESGLHVTLEPSPMVFTEEGRPLLNIVYRGSPRGGSFSASAEVSAARWFPLEALPPMLPTQRELLLSCTEEVSH
jgi:ADP-ribose pyrophosphatase YjhB (NUDIX family)